LAFSTCPPWSCAASFEVARTYAGLPFRLRLGSGDLRPDPRDLRLSIGDAFRFARSFSLSFRAVRCRTPEGSLLVLARSVWDRDSSHGVVNARPSVDLPAQRPLPVVSWLWRASCCPVVRRLWGSRIRSRPSARRCHPSNAFRPCRFSRLRRLSPLSRLQVCCTLLPTMGFAMFQVQCFASLGSSRKERGRAPGDLLLRRGAVCLRPLPPSARTSEKVLALGASERWALTKPVTIPNGVSPFEAFPSPTAVPRHRGRCPLAIRSVVLGHLRATSRGMWCESALSRGP
jgi:hypothetical protein